MWKADASYHTPGAEITGGSISHAEQVITIDDLLISDVFIANIDDAKNHYDVRGEYTKQLGNALGRTFDKNVAQVGVKAARASDPITDKPGGSQQVNASYDTDGSVLAGGLFDAAQKLDEKDVPDQDRNLFVRPAQYYLMAQTTDVINRDWGGAGAYSDGSVLNVAGIHVIKTNNLPSTNVTTGPTAYQGDFSNTVGLIMNREAVGTVKLLDMGMDAEYLIKHQGFLIVAKYAMGHGILTPAAAVELATA